MRGVGSPSLPLSGNNPVVARRGRIGAVLGPRRHAVTPRSTAGRDQPRQPPLALTSTMIIPSFVPRADMELPRDANRPKTPPEYFGRKSSSRRWRRRTGIEPAGPRSSGPSVLKTVETTRCSPASAPDLSGVGDLERRAVPRSSDRRASQHDQSWKIVVFSSPERQFSKTEHHSVRSARVEGPQCARWLIPRGFAADMRRGCPRSVCDDRTEHPRYGTVGEDRRRADRFALAGSITARNRYQAQAQLCRTGHPGGDAGPAQLHFRTPMAAPRARASAASVPLPAVAARLQQTSAYGLEPGQAHLPVLQPPSMAGGRSSRSADR